jgi:acyl-[acyl-carrier-protein]-phospholipid O-acyltransferase/long-chain-fatty-acid--[acyl-carrier-protein] ligase
MPTLQFCKQTLFEGLLAAARTFGADKPVFQDAREPAKTYRDLIRAAIAAGRLASRITAPGDKVGLLLPNLSGTVAMLFGLSASGRIPAMLNYSIGPTGLAWACQTARVRTVITSAKFLETLKLDLSELTRQGVIIHTVEDLRESLSLTDKLWLKFWAWPKPERAISARDPEAIAVVLFTSGSEGRPKGVAITHSNICALKTQLDAVLPCSPDSDRWFSPLPMFHSYGLIGTVISPLMRGHFVYLHLSPLDFREMPKRIAAMRATHLFGSTLLLAHYGRAADPEDFATLEVVISGGEMLADEVSNLYRERFGLTIWEGYGSTESSCAMALNTGALWRPGNTVGPMLPGMEFRIAPLPGLTRGGVLHVRGPNVMKGYFLPDHPGELSPTGSAFGPGWLETGDVAEVLEDGYLRIEGRIKRFAKVAGELVSLDLVERLARRASPQFDHAATVQLTADGETTILFTTDQSLTRARLLAAARDLGEQELAVSRQLVRVDALPILPNGKTDYIRLRHEAEALVAA